MKYTGSKNNIAKYILPIMLKDSMIHEPKKLTEALDIVLSEVKKFRLGDVSTSNQIKIKKYETKN